MKYFFLLLLIFSQIVHAWDDRVIDGQILTVSDTYYIFPLADGTPGQQLTTDGAGNTSWEDAGAGLANNTLSNLSSTAVNVDLKPGANYSLGSSLNRWLGAFIQGTISLKKNGGGVQTLDFAQSSSQSSNLVFTLPVDYGTSGQVLSTNGSGALSWASAATSYAPVSVVGRCLSCSTVILKPFDDYDSNSAYNVSTGSFTAPRDGTYTFIGWLKDTSPNTCFANLTVCGKTIYKITEIGGFTYWQFAETIRMTSGTSCFVMSIPNTSGCSAATTFETTSRFSIIGL